MIKKVANEDEPGWPELAFPTTSTARVRMVAMATSSAVLDVNLDMKLRRETRSQVTNPQAGHYLSNQADPGLGTTSDQPQYSPRIQMHPQLSDKKLGYSIRL